MSSTHQAFLSCCSPAMAIKMSSSLDTDNVIGKPGLELQRVYTDADARKILKNFQDLGSNLDLIEEVQSSPELRSLAHSYLDKASNFNRSFCSSEQCHQNIYEELTAGTGKLLAVMAQLRKEESALDGRLKSVKRWRKRWTSAYTAMIISMLVVSLVLVWMEMPQKVIVVALSEVFRGLQPWLDSLWDEREKELKGARDVAKVMRRFAFQEKNELESIQILAKNLCEELGTTKDQMQSDGLGMVKACAARVEKSAVELLKYIAKV